jgi:Ca2+/Na+ antiporter
MWPFQLYSFVMVVVWISLICSVIINFIELFVVVTDIDSVFIGLTLLACGNSIGGEQPLI